jgi:hypothetical protein
VINKIIGWVFQILSFPFAIAAAIVNNCLSPGSEGSSFLGKAMFFFLTLLSTDTYWQTLFSERPLFPWFEEDWIGWGWLPSVSLFPLNIDWGILSNSQFYLALGFGLVVQIFQSACINGEKLQGLDPRIVGFVAQFFWGVDIILTFMARFPWRYSQPFLIIGCIAYNLLTIFCAEIGRKLEITLSNASLQDGVRVR